MCKTGGLIADRAETPRFSALVNGARGRPPDPTVLRLMCDSGPLRNLRNCSSVARTKSKNYMPGPPRVARREGSDAALHAAVYLHAGSLGRSDA